MRITIYTAINIVFQTTLLLTVFLVSPVLSAFVITTNVMYIYDRLKDAY